MNYKVEVTSPAVKHLKKITTIKIKTQILNKIKSLESYSSVNGISPIKDPNQPDYRIRSGDYRICFDLNKPNKQISVIAIKHRSDCYD